MAKDGYQFTARKPCGRHTVQRDLKGGNRMGLGLAEQEESDGWEERCVHLEEATEGEIQNGSEQAGGF